MGRYSYSSRRIVEYSFRIGIADLVAAGVFKQPSKATSFGKINETRGGGDPVEIAAYSFTVENLGEEAAYIDFTHEYNGKHYTGRHYIGRQPVNLGGYRYFFTCAHCLGRTKHLYFAGNGWACRKCSGLVYQKSRDSRSVWNGQHTAEIMRKKAQALRVRKHPRLANRLEAEADEVEWRFNEIWEATFLRRFGHLA